MWSHRRKARMHTGWGLYIRLMRPLLLPLLRRQMEPSPTSTGQCCALAPASSGSRNICYGLRRPCPTIIAWVVLCQPTDGEAPGGLLLLGIMVSGCCWSLLLTYLPPSGCAARRPVAIPADTAGWLAKAPPPCCSPWLSR